MLLRCRTNFIDWSWFSGCYWTWVAASLSGVFNVANVATGWCQVGRCYEWILGKVRVCLLLMFVFLIHLPLPMLPVPYLLVISSMRTSRKELMDKGSVRGKHASFTPIAMSATGGLAHKATYFYKRLSSLLSRNWEDEYSVVMDWLQCSLSFSLLHSAIQCVHSACSSIRHHVAAPPPMDLVRVESNLPLEDDQGR